MAEDKQQLAILFVCMGNICRSPTAEGVAAAEILRRGWAEFVSIDSAGTLGAHAGSRPDRRATEAAAFRGYDLTQQRARQITAQDFHQFDYILAMDADNLDAMRVVAPVDGRAKVHRLLEFGGLNVGHDVPDPYYGGRHGFEQVLDLVEDAVKGFFDHIETNHLSKGK